MENESGISGIPTTAIVCFALALTLVASGQAGFTEDADSRWPVGSWTGTSPNPAGGTDAWELILERDQTFKGVLDDHRGGVIGISGTWKILNQRLTMIGTWSGGPQAVKGTQFMFDLVRKGAAALQGVQHRVFQPTEVSVSLARTR